jgi:hypothetical protein
MLVWWVSAVECISALARLERDSALDPAAMTLALQRLHKLSAGWHEVDPSDEIRETAARFLRVHALRAADARCNWQRPSQQLSDGQRLCEYGSPTRLIITSQLSGSGW